MKRVIIESPYAGKTPDEKARNVAFARACMKHSFEQGEAPFLSHLLYPQVLDDDDPEERLLGIEAGLRWGEVAEASIVHPNLGISNGMKLGIKRAIEVGRIVIERVLPGWTWPQAPLIEERCARFLESEGWLSKDSERADYQIRTLAEFVRTHGG